MAQIRPTTLPVWAESGDTAQPSNLEIQEGWPVTSIPPSRQRFNWFFNFVGNAVRYLLQFGIAEWDPNETYPVGGKAMFDGLTYRAIQAGSNQQPDTATTYWERWGFSASELSAAVSSVLTKSVAGNSNVALTSAEANYGVLIFTGALTGNINVTVPSVARKWAVINNTTGAYTLTLKTAAGGQVIQQGKVADVICDGTIVRSNTGVKVNTITAVTGVTQTVDYNTGSFFVVRNGSVVAATGTNGTTITLAAAATAGDSITVYSF